MRNRRPRGRTSPKKVVLYLLATFFLVGPVVESVLAKALDGATAGAVGPVVALVVMVALVVLIVKKAMGAPAVAVVAAPSVAGTRRRELRPGRDHKQGFGYRQPASIGDGIRDFPMDES